MNRLSFTPEGNAFEPRAVTVRRTPVMGTGSLGTATVVSLGVAGGDVAPDAIAIGPDDRAYLSRSNNILRINEDDTAEEAAKPPGAGFAPSMTVAGGQLWFASWFPEAGVLRFDVDTAHGDLFTLPGVLRRPTAVAAGMNGDVWVAGGDTTVVGRIDTEGEVFVVAEETVAAPITISSGGVALTASGAPAITDYQNGRVGRTRGHGFAWTDVGGPSRAPSGLTTTADGALWFIDLGLTYRVGRIDGATGALRMFDLPAEIQADPNQGSSKSIGAIVAAADGSVWFTVPEARVVGRVTVAGDIEYVRLPETEYPRGLSIDSRGRVWVTSFDAARIEFPG